MTVDELIELTERLVGETSITLLLEGALAEKTFGWTPEQKALLVRFVAGERPVALPPVTSPGPRLRQPEPQFKWTGDDLDDDDDDAEPVEPVERLGRINGEGRLEIGGDGGSVILP